MEGIVGTKQGIFDVLYECKHRANDGHKLYHVKCTFCGWETDMTKSGIYAPFKCHHVRKDGRYITDKNWANKRIGAIYRDMIDRCYSTKNKDYRFYGAKGIKVCEEWIHDSSKFEEWAVNNGYQDTLTIDRIDSNLGYCPENCRWISRISNSKYKSTTNIINIDGIVYSGRDWAKICNVGINTINKMTRKYGEEKTKEFIKKRLKQPDIVLQEKQTWFSVYNIL